MKLNRLWLCWVFAVAVAERGDGAEPVVVARVGESAITQGDLDREIQQHAARLGVVDLSDPRIREAALEQLIQRRLALANLVAEGAAVSEVELQAALAERRAYHAQRGRSLDELLAAQGTTLESARAELAWSLSWPAYRDKVLTEAAIESFFKEHAARYDGTTRRVSQILLRPDRRGTEPGDTWHPDDLAATLVQAEGLRKLILSGRGGFAEIAERESMAPSKDQGGDLGFIPYQNVVHPRLADAIFALQPGDVSQPVVTSHGVHLLTVTAERRGSVDLADCRREVTKAAELELFRRLAREQRGRTEVVRQ